MKNLHYFIISFFLPGVGQFVLKDFRKEGIYLRLKYRNGKSPNQLRIPTNVDDYNRFMPFIFGINIPSLWWNDKELVNQAVLKFSENKIWDIPPTKVFGIQLTIK